MTPTVHQQITAALVAICPNTWAIELPPNPTYPAIVFDVDSTSEEGWCMGGGYMQHDVNIIVLAHTLEEIDQVLLPLTGGGTLRPALEALPSYQHEDACGDADYEPDPAVYARFMTVRLRTRLY